MSEPIVFFGSGPVAAESLRLLAKDFEIEAVVTKPRPPHHHGDVPVLTAAGDLGLTVKTAANRRELDRIFEDRPLKSRVAILIDFGIIVSKRVIDYFPLGIVNSHFSILPEWRGADPITFAILSGQKQTGVSLMLLVEAMDEGPILAQGTYDIEPDETTKSLTEYLVGLSFALLVESMPKYLSGEIIARTQEEVSAMFYRRPEASYSRKLTKEDGLIDWSKPAEQIEREIRAFIEWPKSRTNFGGLEVLVTAGRVEESSGDPGTTAIVNKRPAVYCGEKTLVIERIKPAGKKEMTGDAFLAGYKKQFLA